MNVNNRELIFSLDIGTRTVIGVVGELCGENFKILASEVVEHEKRNMYDGQIHDINGVVNIVKRIKEKLEQRLDIKLDKVAIAAAGRSLKTYRVKHEMEIDSSMKIDLRLIESLEMEAIQLAQNSLDEMTRSEETIYYCVGYTIVNYYLDGNFMENLEGHRGSRIGADVLATFLPYTVVDSLYTVMDRAGLEVVNLTLEPIAAMNVAVKKSLRLLNIALVDIGAGTSDIAISKDGAITAYAMVSVAGDEITESIARAYLLDFDSAEKLKVKLSSERIHKFVDIVGIEYELGTDEILDKIDDTIRTLANEIASKILEFNDKAPSAVFLVGGGSQLPRLKEYIADYLKLQPERVVVRNTSIIENVIEVPEQLSGPDAITPIGIGLYGIKNAYKDFIEIRVNDQKIKLFNTKTIKVSDALTFIGFNPRKLIPKRGRHIVYYLNGEERKVLGQPGEPAKIYINDMQASLASLLKDGDNVKIIESTEGKEAELQLADCVELHKKIIVNNQLVNLVIETKVNGVPVSDNIRIKDGDMVEFKEIKSVEELLNYLNIEKYEHIVYKDGNIVDSNYRLKDNDIIEIKSIESSKEVSFEKKEVNLEQNEQKCNMLKLVINGEETIIKHDKKSFIFVDIFDYIDIDLTKPQGELVLNVNGNKAEFTQKLKDNDVVDVYWKKTKDNNN